MTGLEELKKQVDEQVKKQKDYSLSFTVLDAQLKNASKLLNDLQLANREQEIVNKNLKEDFAKEKKSLIEALNGREGEISRREGLCSEKEADLRRQDNELKSKIATANNQLIELEKVKSNYMERWEKIKDFLGNAKEILDSFKNA